MSKNDITGDEIKTKPFSRTYEENWEKIFGKKDMKEAEDAADYRIDIIGQNGNEGLHYEEQDDNHTPN